MDKIEHWRDIPNLEGQYSVSSFGRVKSLERISTNKIGVKYRTHERILLPHTDQDGYQIVQIPLNRNGEPIGRHYPWPVHRVVLLAFIGPRPLGGVTRHLDDNPKNNHLNNLCYGTPKQNCEDRVKHGRSNTAVGSRCGRSNILEKDALAIREKYATGKYSMQKLSDMYKVSAGDIIRGKTWRHVEGPTSHGNTRRKISLADRAKIYKMYVAGGITQRELASLYHITQSGISYVIRTEEKKQQ